MYWDSTAKLVGLNFKSNSSVATDITELTLPLLTSSVYDVEACVLGQSSDINGIRTCLAFSAAGATGTFVTLAADTTVSVNVSTNVFGTVGTGILWTQATTDLYFVVKALIKTGANAGNLTVQVAKITAGTFTIYTGSILKLKKLA